MWAISGSVSSIRLGIGWNGRPAISCGEAKSDVRPASRNHPHGGLTKLNAAETTWQVRCGDDVQPSHDADPDGVPEIDDELTADVFEYYSAQPQRGAVGIVSGIPLAFPNEDETFYPQVLVLLPRTAFRALWQVLADTLGRPNVKYDIVIDWLGFAIEGAQAEDAPTWDQFRLGTPILTRNVGVNVSCAAEGLRS